MQSKKQENEIKNLKNESFAKNQSIKELTKEKQDLTQVGAQLRNQLKQMTASKVSFLVLFVCLQKLLQRNYFLLIVELLANCSNALSYRLWKNLKAVKKKKKYQKKKKINKNTVTNMQMSTLCVFKQNDNKHRLLVQKCNGFQVWFCFVLFLMAYLITAKRKRSEKIRLETEVKQSNAISNTNEQKNSEDSMQLMDFGEPTYDAWDETLITDPTNNPQVNKNWMESILQKNCLDMMNDIFYSPGLILSLKNNVDFLLVNENNKIVKLKNKKWNTFKFGVYLIGERITLTLDHLSTNKNENELGQFKMNTSHLWIKDYRSVIDCSGLGYPSGMGDGKGGECTSKYNSFGGGAGHARKGGQDDIANGDGVGGTAYGEETLLTQLHCGSGGGTGHKHDGSSGKGGEGGGIIHLKIGQQLINQGTIKCNGLHGERGLSTYVGGGGSGGSILIEFQPASNSFRQTIGIIICKGGNEAWNHKGADGRIAIYGIKLTKEEMEKIDPKPFNMHCYFSFFFELNLQAFLRLIRTIKF
ncbi:hypothetical protein RFI_23639 [Reticulomyxa filosa]|uniref:Uncharacterized protein n=1 Tax=Reticulomyxa filosa TaxID=46433 RepID=X6MI91_RETFI|nr:hypothetical protein RFI_23639 [Reticulomyxa filosa]|eukprot:ETO13728.1 hypothetical protein RFI_23639 [Reticulomyxa filosa]